MTASPPNDNRYLEHKIEELTQELLQAKSELGEAREQQAATAEILKVISSSPTESQRVFAEISASAARLCDAYDATIFQADGEILRLVGHYGPIPSTAHGAPLKRGIVTAHAILDRRTIQVADLQAQTDAFPESRELARRDGHRTLLAVPLIRAGRAIGAIVIRRTEVRLFSDKQIALLETFADQAVIAIENTRLFEAEQASKRELQGSLEYQTATSEVLNVISRSPTELQPVLDSIAATAARLCESVDAQVLRVQGGGLVMVAQHGTFKAERALPLTRGTVTGRAVIDQKTIHVHDLSALVDTEYPDAKGPRAAAGHRTTLATPLVSRGESLGAILLRKMQVDPFSAKQIALLQTFADQAVIAIENARLFETEQARTRQLQEALEQQTATSKILSVISGSPGKLEPVFDTILRSARQLCTAEFGHLLLFNGQTWRAVALHNVPKQYAEWWNHAPVDAGPATNLGRVQRTRRPDQVADVRVGSGYTERTPLGIATVELGGARTLLSVPLLKEGAVIGCISLYRAEVRPFDDGQVELLSSFADQAVIAIENTRLFEEVQARNRDLTALGEVGRAVSSTLDLKMVLKTIVDRAVELSATDAGSIFYYRKELGRFELGETSGLDDDAVTRFRQLDIAEGQTGLGEAIANRQPLQAPDVVKRPSNALRDAALAAGLHAGLVVPLLGSEGPLGALVLQRRRTGEFPPAVVNLMQSFADQSAIALENARLFEEIARKSRELEIAGQHKSQFVANMSHELRTPLAAMLGYAELLQEGIYGALPERSLPILTRIQSNGKHLLGLINTVLDISKIEAGQFKLNLAEYALGSIVETVMVATESLAATKKLAFKTDIARELPFGLGDEQRLTQVLLNLVGNAIKFTDAGEVRIAAGAENGHFELSVSDTGPGIPAEECEHIFEKFRQVDSSNTRAKGGTGLGLAIAREIVEMHGGRIWVESRLGQGSTFRMELPVRTPIAAGAT